MEGLCTRPRSGRPPFVYRGIMKKVRKLSLKTTGWRASEMREFIYTMTGREFDISYVRRMMRKWGFTQKVPVLEHINRAAGRRIRRFQKTTCKTVKIAKAQGYTVCVQD